MPPGESCPYCENGCYYCDSSYTTNNSTTITNSIIENNKLERKNLLHCIRFLNQYTLFLEKELEEYRNGVNTYGYPPITHVVWSDELHNDSHNKSRTVSYNIFDWFKTTKSYLKQLRDYELEEIEEKESKRKNELKKLEEEKKRIEDKIRKLSK